MEPNAYLRRLLDLAEERGFAIVSLDPGKVVVQSPMARITIESKDPARDLERIAKDDE